MQQYKWKLKTKAHNLKKKDIKLKTNQRWDGMESFVQKQSERDLTYRDDGSESVYGFFKNNGIVGVL